MIPVLLPAVATAGVPLLHVPPGVTSLSRMLCVAQTEVRPDTGTGVGFTVMSLGIEQPGPTE
jgi:hypothetical protein